VSKDRTSARGQVKALTGRLTETQQADIHCCIFREGRPRPSDFGHKDWEQAYFTPDRNLERLSILLSVKFDHGSWGRLFHRLAAA
jgi:hypothetical protein